jgi:DNA-binding NarL/FixJ family response regulator
MNAVELMEAKIILLNQQMKKLEVMFGGLTTPDQRDAAEAAAQWGFSVDIVFVPVQPGSHTQSKQTRELAQALRVKGWSHAKIARAFKVSERTVERWTA